ncbi:acetolactate synthase [bacterium (candidate division B38) B3_B38]|nr:MAG: acetolactate synthase [bacterium (candidate division B38) B3_B38]
MCGVKYIFGVPGDTSIPFYTALWEEKGAITHIMARQERSAAYMADAYARLTNQPGVCEAPSGAGATYILPGVAEANDPSVPLIVLTSDIPQAFRHRGTIPELDQTGLFRPVTKWNCLVSSARDIVPMLSRAFKEATTGRAGAVQLTFPKDVLEEEAEVELPLSPRKVVYPSSSPRPELALIEKAAGAILAARRPVIIAGGGVLLSRAHPELEELAQTAGIPVATTITGKGSIPESHPWSLGVIGDNGGRDYANRYLQTADLAVFIGCKTGSVATRNWTLPPPTTRIIHIDIDPSEVGKNYPTEVGIVADAKAALQDLFSFFISEKKVTQPRTELLNEIRRSSTCWWQSLQPRLNSADFPLSAYRVINELQHILPEDCILAVDSGVAIPMMAACYQQREAGRKILFPRAHGGLGYAIPAAIGVKTAFPDKPVVALVGDGSMGFSAGELETARRLNLPIVFLVFNNSAFDWIKTLQWLHRQREFFGVDFTPVDYSRVGEAFGCRGVRVNSPDQLTEALKKALRSEEPWVIDIPTKPMHQELPPVASWEEMKGERE